MRVIDARQIAYDWVQEAVTNGFPISGAFLHGSATWLHDHDEISPESDVDVLIIPKTGDSLPARAKRDVAGLLLDVSPITFEEIASPELVLGAYHLAGSFRAPTSILYDPSSHLSRIQTVVGNHFANPIWIRRRVENAVTRIEANLEALDAANTREERIIAWLFAAGICTHVLLTAGLRNPTVRNRYPAVRTMLADLDRPEMYEPLIDTLDPNRADAAQVTRFIDQLEPLFDVAASRAQTRFHFSDDLTKAGRIGAVDASRKLVAEGHPRDALFWIGATAARCMTILNVDGAPAECDQFDDYLNELAIWFRVGTVESATAQSLGLKANLPVLREMADQLIAMGTKAGQA